MCGIVFKYNFDKKKPVNNDILQQYDKQKGRGQKGFGVFDGQFMNIVREADEDSILNWLVKKNSNLILFHHRLPTSTINVSKAAHPFSTKDYFGKTQYILVHNGVIRNANELYGEHGKLGIKYSSFLRDMTFNDSEALLWDLTLTLEGRQEKMKAQGSMAFILMKKVNGKLVDMFYGRNTNPLVIRRTPESIELASEGEGVSILPNVLYNFNFKTKTTSKSEMEFPTFTSQKIAGWNSSKDYATHNTKRRFGFGKSQGEQQSLLPAHATHDDASEEEWGSYDEWYAARHGMDSMLDKSPKDKESNWEYLRRKYGKGGTLSSSETAERKLLKSIDDVLEEGERAKIDSASTKSIGQILETKRDSSGKFVVAEVKHEDVIDLDSVDRRDFEPEAGEVQTVAMSYMIEAKGVFEKAYFLLEHEYSNLLDKTVNGHTSFDTLRQQLLMEKAMEFINSDDEYQNEKSVSSIWRALWCQQELAKA